MSWRITRSMKLWQPHPFTLSGTGALLCTALTCLSAIWAAPVLGADDSVLNDLENGMLTQNKAEAADQVCCDRGLYSRSFDLWLKDYANGNTAAAEKDWSGVLQAAKGANSFSKLAAGAYTRLEFMEGEDSRKMEKLGGPLAAIQAIYASTERQCGKCEQLATVANYISNQYKNSYNYKASVSWAKKELEIREHTANTDKNRLAWTLYWLSDCELLAHDFAGAREHAERALALASTGHSAYTQVKARAMLKKIARAQAAK